jgi:hypothetical protein
LQPTWKSRLIQFSREGVFNKPLAAPTATYPATKPTGTFSDPACPTGDAKDKQNEGLLLVKTGPTGNNAAADANINGLPKNTVLSELGYDLRKPVSATDPGSTFRLRTAISISSPAIHPRRPQAHPTAAMRGFASLGYRYGALGDRL